KILGPDPYARDSGGGEALDRQRRILESGKSLHNLEIDSPDDLLDQSDDSGLAGLLHAPKTESAELGKAEPHSASGPKGQPASPPPSGSPGNDPVPGSD
ncbi:MAG: hypothetical protein P8M78_05145, partial [Myxococcota bacterium]|nr:hypothetical protein [Myxococcota bacterium]